MGRFQNTQTGVVVNVDDSKDDRFAGELWGPVQDDAPAAKPAGKSAKQ